MPDLTWEYNIPPNNFPEPFSYGENWFTVSIGEPITGSEHYAVQDMVYPTYDDELLPKGCNNVIHQRVSGVIRDTVQPIGFDTEYGPVIGKYRYPWCILVPSSPGLYEYNINTRDRGAPSNNYTIYNIKIRVKEITGGLQIRGDSYVYYRYINGAKYFGGSGGSNSYLTYYTRSSYNKISSYDRKIPAKPAVWSFLMSSREISDFEAFLEDVHPECSMGELALKAAKTKRILNINTLAYVKDIIALPDFAKSLTNLESLNTLREIIDADRMHDLYYASNRKKDVERKITSAKRVLKKIPADASCKYLAEHYGLKLTIADTKSIAKGIDKSGYDKKFERIGSSEYLPPTQWRDYENVDCECRFTADVRSLSMQQIETVKDLADNLAHLGDNLLRMGYEADILPTPSNLWDMLPYSFVVDWFLPIGDRLERQEDVGYYHTFHPLRCFYSYKARFHLHDRVVLQPGLTREHDYTLYLYNRHCNRRLPDVGIQSDTPSGSFDGHFVEALSLVAQKIH